MFLSGFTPTNNVLKPLQVKFEKKYSLFLILIAVFFVIQFYLCRFPSLSVTLVPLPVIQRYMYRFQSSSFTCTVTIIEYYLHRFPSFSVTFSVSRNPVFLVPFPVLDPVTRDRRRSY